MTKQDIKFHMRTIISLIHSLTAMLKDLRYEVNCSVDEAVEIDRLFTAARKCFHELYKDIHNE